MGNHFDQIANVYDRIWHFSNNYKKWMLTYILEFLEFNVYDTFVDIGGGTGAYTKSISSKAHLLNTPFCIEPSVQMSNVAKINKDIKIFNEDGNSFCSRDLKYDKVLLKESVHYILDRKVFWSSLYDRLNDDGKILIVTRPQEIKMPLFNEAKKAFFQSQPPYKVFVDELKDAGFKVNVKFYSYHFDLNAEVWYSMIRKRFMSTLGKFSCEEIEEGIDEIRNSVKSDVINIKDDIIFITASK
ncbi:MAG: class I SAM-dependent methyltransferase [Epsilonproteobacteria bacterium]|nr:class I SAM-dependent methyltransferase [Campylobacterota bacterium]